MLKFTAHVFDDPVIAPRHFRAHTPRECLPYSTHRERHAIIACCRFSFPFTFGVGESIGQILSHRPEPGALLTTLEDDEKTLSYFGIGDGSEVRDLWPIFRRGCIGWSRQDQQNLFEMQIPVKYCALWSENLFQRWIRSFKEDSFNAFWRNDTCG